MQKEKYKLFYVELLDWNVFRLFFCDKDAKTMTGDDWNDAPYEHNASSPDVYQKTDDIFDVIVELDPSIYLPRASQGNPDGYSVEDINKKKAPWIKIVPWADGADVLEFWANDTYQHVLDSLQELKKNFEYDYVVYCLD